MVLTTSGPVSCHVMASVVMASVRKRFERKKSDSIIITLCDCRCRPLCPVWKTPKLAMTLSYTFLFLKDIIVIICRVFRPKLNASARLTIKSWITVFILPYQSQRNGALTKRYSPVQDMLNHGKYTPLTSIYGSCYLRLPTVRKNEVMTTTNDLWSAQLLQIWSCNLVGV